MQIGRSMAKDFTLHYLCRTLSSFQMNTFSIITMKIIEILLLIIVTMKRVMDRSYMTQCAAFEPLKPVVCHKDPE